MQVHSTWFQSFSEGSSNPSVSLGALSKEFDIRNNTLTAKVHNKREEGGREVIVFHIVVLGRDGVNGNV